MTDAVREAFERWMSEDGKWPDAVAHRYGHYVLAQTESAWKAWQAALSEQPSTPTTPNASLPPLGDGPRKKIAVTVEVPENWEKRLDMQWVLEREIQADRWSWDWPQPAETAPSVRVPLTDGQILSCVRAIGTRVPMGLTRDRGPYEVTEPTWFLTQLIRAVIAEYERANGIGKGGQA